MIYKTTFFSAALFLGEIHPLPMGEFALGLFSLFKSLFGELFPFDHSHKAGKYRKVV